LALVRAPTSILLCRNEGGQRSPERGFSPELGTWPIQSTRSIPLFSRQATRPVLGAGSPDDRLPVGTAGAKPVADSQACAARGIGGPAWNHQIRRQGVRGVLAPAATPSEGCNARPMRRGQAPVAPFADVGRIAQHLDRGQPPSLHRARRSRSPFPGSWLLTRQRGRSPSPKRGAASRGESPSAGSGQPVVSRWSRGPAGSSSRAAAAR